MGWGGLLVIISGLVSLVLLSGAASIAASEEEWSGRGAFVRLLEHGGIAAMAVFVCFVLIYLMSEVVLALS